MLYNKSEIMKNAWKMVKEFKMSISAALKSAWAAAKGTLKQLHIKEWFANKLANELRCNLFHTEIFAVLRETEKAYNVLFSTCGDSYRTAWIPKSCTIECPGSIDFHTRFGLSFGDALREFHDFWANYR